MLLLASDLSWVMFILGLLVMISVLLRRYRRYYAKSGRQRNQTRRKVREPSSESPLIDAPVELNRWYVEMHELARELKGELDSKMIALQVLIRHAQSEADRLQAAIQHAEQLGIAVCSDPLGEIEGLLTSDTGLQHVVAKLETVPTSHRAQLGGSPEQLAVIYALADQGAGSETIAARLGAPLGDVEMALSLRTESRS